jgi:hypothetical protein
MLGVPDGALLTPKEFTLLGRSMANSRAEGLTALMKKGGYLP